ncbi:MAG: hypothetical protein IJY25_04950 [Bacilli bacterium]|nr:hypothetical protein [Bacilli bacterium]
MTNEMVELYKKLDTNEKRNEFSALMIKLDQLINQLIIQNNINTENLKNVKNYDSVEQANNNEDDMMLFFYDDLWNIKNKILLLLISENRK